MESLEDAFDQDRALVFGIGGGGDVVGAVPTARLLEAHGVETILGGVAWEPAPADPTVGPTGFEDMAGIERVSDTVAWASPETRTSDGTRFAEAGVAEVVDERPLIVDLTAGLDGMVDGLEAACDVLDVDLVVGTDSGGDALARGDEAGLRSPVTDALGLATLADLARPTMLGVFGYGSDGELTRGELEAGLARAAERDGLLGAWGLTPTVADELDALLEVVRTEASRLPVEAFRGGLGERSIRRGAVTVDLVPPAAVTFYFDPPAVIATSDTVPLVREARDLHAIEEAFAAAGLVTEFTLERERLSEG